MARPLKNGLDYYPLNVDFFSDIKVRRLLKAGGSQSISILIALLGNIYRDEGYYMRWDNDMPFLIADLVGVTEGAVMETVNKAVLIGFFHAGLFERYKILTSKGIQARYLEAVSRRRQVFLIKNYLLLDVNVYNNVVLDEVIDSDNGVNVDNNSVNVCRSTQSKVKESKEYTTTSTSEDLKLFFQNYIENGFGAISGLSKEILIDDANTYGIAWCNAAMEIAVSCNKRMWAYVRAILKRWNSQYNLSDKPWEVEAVEGRKKYSRQFKADVVTTTDKSGGASQIDWTNDPDHF